MTTARAKIFTLLWWSLSALLSFREILKTSLLLLVDQLHLGCHPGDFTDLDLFDIGVVRVDGGTDESLTKNLVAGADSLWIVDVAKDGAGDFVEQGELARVWGCQRHGECSEERRSDLNGNVDTDSGLAVTPKALPTTKPPIIQAFAGGAAVSGPFG